MNTILPVSFLYFLISDGIVRAATTPIMARVISTSARVKAWFLFIYLLSMQFYALNTYYMYLYSHYMNYFAYCQENNEL